MSLWQWKDSAGFGSQFGVRRVLANAISSPSGDHAGPASNPSAVVSARTLVPLASMAKMSPGPPVQQRRSHDGCVSRWTRSLVKASCEPSGDQDGSSSRNSLSVRGLTSEPSGRIV
jgi:hypothetical protein